MQLEQETTKFGEMMKSVSEFGQKYKRAREGGGVDGVERKVKKQREDGD